MCAFHVPQCLNEFIFYLIDGGTEPHRVGVCLLSKLFLACYLDLRILYIALMHDR